MGGAPVEDTRTEEEKKKDELREDPVFSKYIKLMKIVKVPLI